jgi:hypothetical protein
MVLQVGATGLIDANGKQALVVDTGANTVTNAGLIEAVGAGGLTIKSALQNNGRLLASNATLTEMGAVTGTGFAQIKAAGTLVFEAGFSETVRFMGVGGELVLADSQGYSGTIAGFSKTGGTTLDLRDIGFVSSTEATWSRGILTVTDGTHTAHIKLAGNFAGSNFTAGSDGHGGVLVTDPAGALFAQAVAGGLQGAMGGAVDDVVHTPLAQVHPQLAAAVG